MTVLGKANDLSGILVMQKVAGENISALKVVILNDNDEFELADELTYEQSLAIGVAIQAGLTGTKIKAVVSGIINDASLTFPLHSPIYLGSNGQMTTTEPSGENHTVIGHGLGNGSMLVSIREPIII